MEFAVFRAAYFLRKRGLASAARRDCKESKLTPQQNSFPALLTPPRFWNLTRSPQMEAKLCLIGQKFKVGCDRYSFISAIGVPVSFP